MLKDINKQIGLTLDSVRKDVLGNKQLSLLLVFFFVAILLSVGLSAALFWLIFFTFLFYEWNPKITAYLSFIPIITTAILLILKDYQAAEISALYIFYLLLITVILEVIYYVKNPEEYVEPKFKIQTEEIIDIFEKEKFPNITAPIKKQKRKGNIFFTIANVLLVCSYLILFGPKLPEPEYYPAIYLYILIFIVINSIFTLITFKKR